MGIPVLIMGESGSGKTASLRNFGKGEIGIFNVVGKPLPFKGNLPKLDGGTSESIMNSLKDAKVKCIVIDDSQYLMAFELFDRAKEVGYQKFTDIALNFRNLIQYVIKNMPSNVIVYFLHHTEQTDFGKIKAKTSGKMLDNQLTLEGLFTIVLMAKTDGKRYWFETQSNGFTTCKSPMDMFDSLEIDNDLKTVDNIIREYYDLEEN